MYRPSLTALELQLTELQLREPVHISGYTFIDVPVLHTSLTAGGLVGRGESAGVYYMQDRPADMFEAIEHVRSEIEAGLSRQSLRSLLPAGGARNAVDCAMWELEALQSNCAVWQLAGIPRPQAKVCTMTLGADTPARMVEKALAYRDPKALKLKLTGDADLDIARVLAVRSARPDVWMSVDANQGYTPGSIEKLLDVLVDANIQLLEQPFARGREAEMANVEFPVATAADESCLNLDELEDIRGLFDVVNIKLDKCGGLTEGLMMAARARQLGMKVMVGNMAGTSLAMAPAYVLSQLCDVVDLDGPLFISNDCHPAVSYNDGEICCADDVWGGSAR